MDNVQEYWALVVNSISELSHHSKVGATSSKSPEEICITFLRSLYNASICKYDPCSEEVIDDESVLAGKKSRATSKRESSDTSIVGSAHHD